MKQYANIDFINKGLTKNALDPINNKDYVTIDYLTSGVSWGNINGNVTGQTDLIEYFDDRFEVKGQLDSLHNLGLFQGQIEELGVHWTATTGATMLSTIQAIYHVKHLENGITLAGSYGGNCGAKIYRSTDYGVTWDSGTNLPIIPIDENSSTFQISYLYNGIVIVGGYWNNSPDKGYTFRSTDYGVTWSGITMPNASQLVSCYTDLGNGTIISGGLSDTSNIVWKSTNYGLTWLSATTMGSSLSTDYITSMTYLTNNILIGTSTDNIVYRSVDTGMTWISGFTATSDIHCSSYFGNGVVVVGTENGTLYRSHDYGITWSTKSASTSIRFITYVGSGVAFYSTTNLSGTGAIYKTIDNGSTWTKIQNPFFSGTTISLKMSYAGNGLLFATGGHSSYGYARVYRSELVPQKTLVSQELLLSTGFTGNLNTGITTIQELANAVDTLSAGSTGIPNPTTYTYSGSTITGTTEDLGNSYTIQKRYSYYSGGSGQDGSIQIMETKNTKANLWIRSTYSYTGGLLTTITNSGITSWSI